MGARVVRLWDTVQESARVLLLAVLCLLVASVPVLSGELAVITADPASFREVYDKAVPVSGDVVVGVRLGSSLGLVNVDDVRLPVLSGNAVCVRTLTQDGRFSANNIYAVPSSQAPGTVVRLSPVTLKYGGVLSGYDQDAFALAAFMASEGRCQPEGAVHLPQILPAGVASGKLTVLINSRGRYSVMSVAGGADVVCSGMPNGARLAYDKICVADVAGRGKGMTPIKIALDDGFGLEVVSLMVLIPQDDI